MYLTGIRFRSKKNVPFHQKIIFLLSFPSTSEIILENLYQEYNNNLIICYTRNGSTLAKQYQKKGCSIYSIDNYATLLTSIVPLVKGAKIVLCDNYYAFLSSIDFREETKNIQLWHANGAIKRFGLEAPYAKKSSPKDQARYQAVYQTWTHYMVSSNKMKTIFEKNYRVKVNSLNFGYPATDVYFDKRWVDESLIAFQEKFPTSKKILLYAPTYREGKTKFSNEFYQKVKELQKDWLVFIKYHPHEEERLKELAKYPSVIIDFKGLTLQQILPSVDCLVTDYSSIPFEYSLANSEGKIVFYCYDYVEYDQKVGIEEDFTKWAPGEVVYDSKALVLAINAKKSTTFSKFNQEWNQYVSGNANKQLIEWVKKNNET